MKDNYHIQPLTISTDLGRENINELGRKSPFFQFSPNISDIIWGPDLELNIGEDYAYNCKTMELIIHA